MIKELVKEEAIDIEELMKEIKMLHKRGITELMITQTSSKSGTKVFYCENLTIETEDDVVFCGDDKEEIVKNYSVLLIFLKSGLLMINKRYIDDKICFELQFKDVNVLIEEI